MKHLRGHDIFATSEPASYRRMIVCESRLRSATLSFAPGDAAAEHAHPGSDEIFFVVSGRGKISVEGATLDVGPGDVVHLLAGERHAIVVAASAPEPLVLLAVVAPDLGDDAVMSGDPFPLNPPP